MTTAKPKSTREQKIKKLHELLRDPQVLLSDVQSVAGEDASLLGEYLGHMSLLERAIGTGRDDVVEWLICAGAPINSVDEKQNPCLFYAISMQREKAIDLLIKAGAHLHSVDQEGWSALHFAIIGGGTGDPQTSLRIFTRLIDLGLDLEIVTKSPAPLTLIEFVKEREEKNPEFARDIKNVVLAKKEQRVLNEIAKNKRMLGGSQTKKAIKRL